MPFWKAFLLAPVILIGGTVAFIAVAIGMAFVIDFVMSRLPISCSSAISILSLLALWVFCAAMITDTSR